ncbi:g10386 [Coccomyxa viridis]|uniref:G10386 protein n=1 Tax=Coccomyxa viridis TaxID=1274662 RepID=A0ABP1G7S5_9CHLO
MVWFLVPVGGCIGAAGAIYGLHSAANATSIYVAKNVHGIEEAYTWPPLASVFEDRPQRHNGTALGMISAVTAAIPAYVIVARGMQRSVNSAAGIGQPAKVESFAQLARSLAPGMGQRGVAALAAAVVAGAVRPLADGNNMKES